MNKVFKRSPLTCIVNHYDTISNVISALLSIGCSIIASSIYDTLKTNTSNKTDLFIKCVLIGVVIIVIVLFSLLSRWIKNKYIIIDSRYKDYIKKAYLKIQELNFESQVILQKEMTSPVRADCLFSWSIKGLQQAIEKCYDFFIASFGEANEFIETISFEVTFMTLSYNDGMLTIAGYSNRERKQPTSMLKRKDNIDHYKDTVAAELYNLYNEHKHPAMVIVSDTTQPISIPGIEEKKEYKALYSGQLQNSKSSIIVPVLSRKDELLGVMVVYCDQKDFFKEEDRRFWEAMTELFAVEIGTYKLILDVFDKEGKKPF